ncbi:hydantoinase/oxoprolinase family protein [Sphingobium sp. SCG-1]|uniref:hydantoinase/oxoprolinase family protein n=1 Tax=Sphingobium sp. SCG-1 TaxID=2072936 RepID=UPI00166FC62D|nr:hydantoinase/oxoprolinase family protein [Sphingobium sp. SCG-1]
MARWLVGVDTGGTFTDLLAFEQETGALKRAKVPSVPQDPSLAVINALEVLFADGVEARDVVMFTHGTTVATNALLEGRGVKTGLLITRGFRAVYEARGWSQPTGSDLLDTFYQKPPLLVPQSLTEEAVERLDFRGEVLIPLDEEALRQSVRNLLAKGVEAIAICFLYSFVNSTHEELAARIVAEEAPSCRVSISSHVLPVIREYPRLSTTVIDAYVGPKIEVYLMRLTERLRERGIVTPQTFLMQSNGGLMRIALGARHPNQTLLSGPAAGVIAGADLARAMMCEHAITFDIGGTSTDLAIIVNGRLPETAQGEIAGQDIGTPMLRVRTLGAGGGTIAAAGRDGLLKVGPQSAGSVPGPACYGRGGTQATVTDANLVLGALSGKALLAGTLSLDEAAAHGVIANLAAELGIDSIACASGILKIVNTQMAIDVRIALQEQGQDPRKFTLIAFGGAGPLHAAAVAREVGIRRILVPLYPGLNCAMGMLQTSVRHSYLKSDMGGLAGFPAERIESIFDGLCTQAYAEAEEEGFERDAVTLTRLLDLRYLHQGYTLGVICPDRISGGDKAGIKASFDELHHQMYGQSAPAEDIEIVTFRLQSEISVPTLSFSDALVGTPDPLRKVESRELFDLESDRFLNANVFDRADMQPGQVIAGPALIQQYDSTVVILARQDATVMPNGTLVIEEQEDQ